MVEVDVVALSLKPRPMGDVPADRLVVLVSPWGQLAVARWDNGRWRYGPAPGETWDVDYPIGWLLVQACGWPSAACRGCEAQ